MPLWLLQGNSCHKRLIAARNGCRGSVMGDISRAVDWSRCRTMAGPEPGPGRLEARRALRRVSWTTVESDTRSAVRTKPPDARAAQSARVFGIVPQLSSHRCGAPSRRQTST